jgi:hypothetical protein
VIEAMKTDLDEASEEMVQAMEFFLTIVIPCVCPEINSKRDWLAGSGHLEKFGGPGSWKHDMATGLLVVSEFSNTVNLEHNARLSHDDDQEHAPAIVKKKRKRLHTANYRDNLHSLYYKIINDLKEVESNPGFARRMDEWDGRCYSDPNKDRRGGPENRRNMVPLAHRGGPSHDESYFNSFLQSNPAFSGIFAEISNVSPISTSGLPTNNDPTVLGTQQSPFTTPV